MFFYDENVLSYTTIIMTLNWIAIIILSIAQFAVGSLWFGPIFGKIWMKIHHKEPLTQDQEKELMKWMRKLMLTEFMVSVLITITMAYLIITLPTIPWRKIWLIIWLWFILPQSASNVIRWNDDRKWMCTKIALTAGYRIIALVAIGYTLSMRH